MSGTRAERSEGLGLNGYEYPGASGARDNQKKDVDGRENSGFHTLTVEGGGSAQPESSKHEAPERLSRRSR